MSNLYQSKTKEMHMEKVVEVIIGKCMGCHSCELACAVAHSKSKELVEAFNEEKTPYSRLILEMDEGDVIPFHCRHCEDAPCISVCPTNAMSRTDAESPVTLVDEKCIGCTACLLVCPFGVIQKKTEGDKLAKCDLCIERLEAGKEPACTEACPTGAIRFVSSERHSTDKRKETIRKYRVALTQTQEEAGA
jgi:anaerobic carbon-monoxide dehydrogenase iron sulfur subunit